MTSSCLTWELLAVYFYKIHCMAKAFLSEAILVLTLTFN